MLLLSLSEVVLQLFPETQSVAWPALSLNAVGRSLLSLLSCDSLGGRRYFEPCPKEAAGDRRSAR